MLMECFELSKNEICYLFSILTVLKYKNILNNKIDKGTISS